MDKNATPHNVNVTVINVTAALVRKDGLTEFSHPSDERCIARAVWSIWPHPGGTCDEIKHGRVSLTAKVLTARLHSDERRQIALQMHPRQAPILDLAQKVSVRLQKSIDVPGEKESGQYILQTNDDLWHIPNQDPLHVGIASCLCWSEAMAQIRSTGNAASTNNASPVPQ